MFKGQLVTVRLYGGKTAIRRVVADKQRFVVVCAEEEFRRAQEQAREPEGIGFPLEDIVADSHQARKGVDSEQGSIHRRSEAGD